MTPPLLFAAAAAAGAMFLIVQGVLGMTRRKSILEANQALIKRQQAAYDSPTLSRRIALAMGRYGYEGSVPAATFAGGTAAVITAGCLRALGLSVASSALFCIPVTLVAAFLMLSRIVAAREAQFGRQLLQLLRLVSGELETGSNPQQALEHAVGAVDDPLRTELIAVLDAAKVSNDLVGEVERLRDRYPSRAVTLLITALEIDRDLGAAIQQPLARAAESLEKDFELEEAAMAEAATVKAEFHAVFIGIGAIGAMVFLTQGADARSAVLTNMFAVGLLLLGVANYLFGFVRVNRMLKKAGKVE